MKKNNYKNGLGWILTILLFGVVATLQAAPGDLDTTFAGSGKRSVNFFGGGRDIVATAGQADGKLVVADVGSVSRYNPDGSLDNSFSGGKVNVSFGPDTSFSIGEMKIQPSDGKIVIVGRFTAPNSNDGEFAIVRLNTDGTLDNSFHSDGKRTTPILVSAFARSLAIQSDGKIVVVGESNRNSGGFNVLVFAAVRYNTSGTVDTSFGGGGDGIVIIDFSNGDIEVARAVTIQPDGKIVIAGAAEDGNQLNAFAVARLNINGTLDTSFDGDGKVVRNIITGASDFANAVAIQSGSNTMLNPDKIVVAGHTCISSNCDSVVARFDLDGSFDTSFGGLGQGIVITPEIYEANAVVIQNLAFNQRKIIIAGTATPGSNYDFAVARYNSDGTLDTSFDGDGLVFTEIGANRDEALAMTLHTGKLVVAGFGSDVSGPNVGGFAAIVRYNLDGSLDTTFDGDGKRTEISSGGNFVVPNGVAIQSDGKIVMPGFSSVGNADYRLMRLNNDGSLDNSFSEDGRIALGINTSDEGFNAVAIQADGKIVAAGFNEGDFSILRFNTDGSPDTGLTIVGTSGYGNDVAIQPDGKIVVAGFRSSGGDSDFAVVRYHANGLLDTSFDGDGKATITFGTDGDVGYSVAIQADGKIVVAGVTSSTALAVARFTANGSPDPSFNGAGKVIVNTINADSVSPPRVAIQTDGKIVVAGYDVISNLRDFAVARLNTDGTPDTSFDGDGIVTTSIGASDDYANAVAIQPNGKIVAAGRSFNPGNNFITPSNNFAVVRYNSNGSLDTSYGNGGKVTVDVSNGGEDSGRAMAFDPLGRAVIAGVARGGLFGVVPGGLFGVIRLLGDAPITPSFEADVASRPNGNGAIQSDDLVQMRRFLNCTGTQPDSSTSEFQRADSSPIATSGDGALDTTDIIQSRRYQNGSNALQAPGGPIAPNAPRCQGAPLLESGKTAGQELTADSANEAVVAAPRELRVESASSSPNQPVIVNIRVDAMGDEAEYGFILSYDQTILSNPIIGAGTAGASVRSCNTATAGTINCSVGGFPNNNPTSSDTGIGEITAGTNQLLITVTFTVAANAPAGATPLTLSNVNASSDAPQLFTPTATNGMVTILAPTAAAVSVSGRVMTATGRGLMNTTVLLTDSFGNTRTMRTSAFGYYRFEEVAAGQTCVFSVRSKRYQFAPQVVTIMEDMEELNFAADW